MLIDNNITHIDYFILTHYHSDHYGNFKNLVNDGYIDSATHFYMPAEVTKWSGTTTLIAEYKTYFQNHNLQYYVPEENEILSIENLELKFFNCDVKKVVAIPTLRNASGFA